MQQFWRSIEAVAAACVAALGSGLSWLRRWLGAITGRSESTKSAPSTQSTKVNQPILGGLIALGGVLIPVVLLAPEVIAIVKNERIYLRAISIPADVAEAGITPELLSRNAVENIERIEAAIDTHLKAPEFYHAELRASAPTFPTAALLLGQTNRVCTLSWEFYDEAPTRSQLLHAYAFDKLELPPDGLFGPITTWLRETLPRWFSIPARTIDGAIVRDEEGYKLELRLTILGQSPSTAERRAVDHAQIQEVLDTSLLRLAHPIVYASLYNHLDPEGAAEAAALTRRGMSEPNLYALNTLLAMGVYASPFGAEREQNAILGNQALLHIASRPPAAWAEGPAFFSAALTSALNAQMWIDQVRAEHHSASDVQTLPYVYRQYQGWLENPGFAAAHAGTPRELVRVGDEIIDVSLFKGVRNLWTANLVYALSDLEQDNQGSALWFRAALASFAYRVRADPTSLGDDGARTYGELYDQQMESLFSALGIGENSILLYVSQRIEEGGDDAKRDLVALVQDHKINLVNRSVDVPQESLGGNYWRLVEGITAAMTGDADTAAARFEAYSAGADSCMLRMVADFAANQSVGRDRYNRISRIFYERAFEAGLRDFDLFNQWGSALSNAGRYQEAVERYDDALQYTGSTAWPYLNRAIAQIELGQHREAAESARQSLRRTVTINGVTNLVVALYRDGDHEGVVTAYEQYPEVMDNIASMATPINIEEPSTLLSIAASYCAVGQLDDAMRVAARARLRSEWSDQFRQYCRAQASR